MTINALEQKKCYNLYISQMYTLYEFVADVTSFNL